MSTAITIHKPMPMSVEERFTTPQLELIKRTVAAGATNDELAMFLHQCAKTGLDPLARQIYFVKRQGKGTIQTGIDGYRLVADRTGAYAGNDDPEYDDPEGNPKWARVTVWKMVAGQRCPFTATARWSQHYPGDQQGWAWKKMPHLMLGKCAEALALRKAFPAELSGVYTTEEMAQADKLPPDGKTEAEAIREYEKPHMAVIAKAEGWSTVEGRVSSVAEKKDLLWFDMSGQLACGDPKLLMDLDTIAVGDEVAFYGTWPESKSKKKFLVIKEVGLVLKPSSQAPKVETGDLVPVLKASVAKVESEKFQATDDDIPF